MLNPFKLTEQDITNRVQRKATSRDVVKSCLALCVTIALLAYMLHTVGWRDAVRAMGRISPANMVLILCAALGMALVVHTDRVRAVFHTAGCSMRWRDAVWLRLGTLPLALVLPAKSGDLLRAFYLRTHFGCGLVRGAGIVVAEKMLALAGTLCLLMMGVILFWDASPVEFAGVAAAVLSICALLSGSFFLLKKGFRNANDIGGIPPKTFNMHFLLLIAYSAFSLSAESIVAWLALRALGHEIPCAAILYYIPLIQVAALLPFTMRGMGVRETGYCLLLKAFAPQSDLFTAGIIVSFSLYVMPTLIGFFFMQPLINLSFPNNPPEFVPDASGQKRT